MTSPMAPFSKRSSRDGDWEGLCHLEDRLVGRKPARPGVAPPSPPFQRVVVAIDGHMGTEEALQWAALLAKAGAKLWLATVGASGGKEELASELFQGHTADPEASLRRAMERLQALGASASPVVLHGLTSSALSRFAAQAQADLIVVASPARGRDGQGGPLGVGQTLKAMEACSLLVARKAPGRAVWAATDGSRPARQALATAYALSQTLALPLTVLHARELKPGPDPAPRPPPPVAAGSGRIVFGPAAHALLEATAYEPDVLFVLGSRGRTGGLLNSLGTVSDQVLARAPCPVLVLRPTG